MILIGECSKVAIGAAILTEGDVNIEAKHVVYSMLGCVRRDWGREYGHSACLDKSP